MDQNQATFIFNGTTQKLNTATVTAASLGKTFKLEEDSIKLVISNGNFIEQENGKFPKFAGGKTYEVLGDPQIIKIMAKKPKFKQGEIRNLNDELAMQTKGMGTILDGLAQAPKAVSMINTLTTLAACTNDCSLENERTVNLIKLLKTAGSFKGSLVQLINEATGAFVFADSTTSKIKMKLSAIPDTLLSSIKVASTPKDPGAISILDINEKRITNTANFCADEAEKVAKLFEGVSALVEELVQAATTTQGLNEEQVRSIKKSIEEMTIQKAHLQEENEKKVIEIAEQKEKTKEAREEYKAFVQNAATTAQSTYRAEQEREDKLSKDAAEFRKEISALAIKLKTTDAEKLELDSVIEYLSKGLLVLNNLQEVWLELAKFYRAVVYTVSGPLKDTLKEFIEYQNKAIVTPHSDKIAKRMLVSAMKGCGICFQVIKCSETSQQISAKYVLPRIFKANANLQLMKEAAQMKLLETNTEFETMESELKEFIKDSKEKILQSTEDKIGDYTKQIAIIEN